MDCSLPGSSVHGIFQAAETEKSFEVMSSSAARNADYEIVSIYGRKYIIFSSGSDIEVLNYWEALCKSIIG